MKQITNIGVAVGSGKLVGLVKENGKSTARYVSKQEIVELYGNKHDPEVQQSINKIAITGRKVLLKPRPSFDSGLGPCGKKQCSCQTSCENATA